MKRLLGMAWLLLCSTSLHATPLYFVEAEVDTATPWVQAQVTLRLRFFHAAAVSDVKLAAPQARLADIQPLNDTRQSEAQRGGQRYRVHEQLFAILPFASGPIELTGASASGQLPGSARRTTWSAPPIALAVRPAPLHLDHWLPARSVRLSESWSADNPAIGQPLLRSVRIEATGVTAAQLPELHFDVAGASVLPHPPRLATRIDAGALVASREQDFEILPTRAGTLVVPPLQLVWWTVGMIEGKPQGTDEMALATLSGRSFSIPDPARRPIASAAETDSRLGIAAALAGLLLLLFLAQRARPLWRLWRACRRGDASALLEWSQRRVQNSPPGNLIVLAERVKYPPAAAILRALDATRYGNAPSPHPDRRLFFALLRLS